MNIDEQAAADAIQDQQKGGDPCTTQLSTPTPAHGAENSNAAQPKPEQLPAEWTPALLSRLFDAECSPEEAIKRICAKHNAELAAAEARATSAEMGHDLCGRMYKDVQDELDKAGAPIKATEGTTWSAHMRVRLLGEQLLSALAAIEHVRKREGCIVTDERLAQIIENVDLSALRKHDNKIWNDAFSAGADSMKGNATFLREDEIAEARKPLVALLLESRRLLNKWAARYAEAEHARKDQRDSRAAVTAIDALAKVKP